MGKPGEANTERAGRFDRPRYFPGV